MTTYQTDTKSKISRALWKLMENEMIEDITITMICQEAGVGRRSFYRHFKSKWGVLEYELKLKNDEFATFCEGCRTMEDMMGMSFQFFKKQKKQLRLLQQNNLMSILYRIMQSGDLFTKELDVFMQRSMLPAYLREYVANVIAATHTSLLMTWANHNFRESWQEIARFEIGMFAVMEE